MRILQVITDRDRRGAQVFAVDLAAGLRQLGHDVSTVALAPGRQDDLPVIETLGSRPLLPRTLLSLRRRAGDVDVVIAHGSTTLVASAAALMFTRVPFVYRQISDPLFWASSWARRVRVAAYLRRTTSIVCLSPSVARAFGDHYWLPQSRICVIPNAVPRGVFAPADSRTRSAARASLGLDPVLPTVAYVGALVSEKGVDLLVKSVGQLPGVQLLIAGSGSAEAELVALAARYAPGRVMFAGTLRDPQLAYEAADVVALASRGGDSMPAVLIEAGLCGVPAVSTPVGAIPEMVRDGETGFIVPIDDLESLGDRLGLLLSDAGLRERFGEASSRFFQGAFTIEATAPLWSELLERSLPRHSETLP